MKGGDNTTLPLTVTHSHWIRCKKGKVQKEEKRRYAATVTLLLYYMLRKMIYI